MRETTFPYACCPEDGSSGGSRGVAIILASLGGISVGHCTPLAVTSLTSPLYITHSLIHIRAQTMQLLTGFFFSPVGMHIWLPCSFSQTSALAAPPCQFTNYNPTAPENGGSASPGGLACHFFLTWGCICEMTPAVARETCCTS